MDAPTSAAGQPRRRAVNVASLDTAQFNESDNKVSPCLSTSSSVSAASESGTSHAFSPSPRPKGALLHISETPRFLRFNDAVLHGYRDHPLSVGAALKSMLQWHNETANIYTHLLGAVLCIYWVIAVDWRWHENRLHYGVVAFADLCSAVCFFGSVSYHTLMNAMRDEGAYKRLMSLDVYGIWVVNTGAAAVLTYLLLPCAPKWVHAALIVAPVLGSLVWIAFIAKGPASRALAFAISWLVRILSIVGTYAFGASHWPLHIFALHIATELLPPLGATINVLRIPEKWAPGRFNFVNSHTVMHVCVAIGMLAQHWLGINRAGVVDADHQLAECVARDTEWFLSFLPGFMGTPQY